MKLKNGADRVMIWRNQADVTLVLAAHGAEVYRRTLDMDPRAISEEIWLAAARHLARVSRLARRAAAQPPVLQPLMLRKAVGVVTAPCRILVPFGPKGEYRLEITSNLYPLPDDSRRLRLQMLADEIAACARIARERSQSSSVAALNPAA